MKHISNSCPYREISAIKTAFFLKMQKNVNWPRAVLVFVRARFDTISCILLKLAGQIH